MKDRDLDSIIESVMEEDANCIYVNKELKGKVLNSFKSETFIDKLIMFLNKSINISIPVFSGTMALIIFLTFLPIIRQSSEIKYDNVKIISVGNSQIIIRNIKEVSKDEKNKY